MAGPRPHEPGRSVEPDARPAPGRPLAGNARAKAGTSRRVKHLILLPGGSQEVPEGAAPAPDAAPPADQGRPEARRDVRLPSNGHAHGHALRGGGPARAQAAQAAELLPLEVAPATSFRVKLRVITRSVTRSKAPGMPFIIFASALVTLAVLGLVVLRVMVDQTSFRVDDLQTRIAQQQGNLTELRYQDSLQEAPGRIATLAGQLGLVPAGTPQLLAGPGAPALALATASPATVTPATVKPATTKPATTGPVTATTGKTAQKASG